MLGIGLGGFVDGLEKGSKFRERKEQRARDKIIQEREDTEYNRAVQQRDEISAINTQAQAEFKSRVDAGTAKPDQFDTFWNEYALPKLKNTYLAQGNIEMADRVQKWGESEDTRAGAKLAMSALTKAQTGDVAGALADATEAGKRKGYLSHGYEIMGQDTIVDPSGQLQGYRLQMKGPDGKTVTQDLPLAQVPKLIATYLNPEAAWQSQIAAQEANTKRKTDLQDYEEKKKIDKQYGTGENKPRTDAIAALRKRMDGGLAGDETKFDDLPRDEQETLISKEIELQSGQPGIAPPATTPTGSAGPGRNVLVDTATGQPVPPPRSQSAPAERPAERTPENAERMRASERAAGATSMNDQSPEEIAAELQRRGVPENQWPEALRRALAQRQRAEIGLGG